MKELNEKKEFIRGQCRRGEEKDRFEGLLVFFCILTIISITKRLKIFQKPPIE
jgi:hypothetical protein